MSAPESVYGDMWPPQRPLMVCHRCGSLVADEASHEAWHQWVGRSIDKLDRDMCSVLVDHMAVEPVTWRQYVSLIATLVAVVALIGTIALQVW